MNRILVVDNEKSVLDTCRQILVLKKYEVETAENLTSARRQLQSRKFDLIITDLRIGVEKGENLIREVKSEYADTGIIVMTGYVDIQSAVECIRLGAYDYLPKPFEMQEFLGKVEKYFESANLKKTVSKLKDVVALYHVAMAIAQLKPLDEVLAIILNNAEKEVGADGGSIALWSDELQTLVIKVASGANRDKAIGMRCRLGERVCGYAAEKKEPVLLQDELNTDPRFKNEKVYEGVKSGMSIPMLLQDELVGVLNLRRTIKEDKFTQDDLDRAFVLAEIAALAISNSRMFDKMKDLDELKSHFISTVSHELRTPITSIKASVDLMGKIKDEEKLQKFIEITRRNILRMERLVKDLLNFSQFEQKTLLISKKTINFNQVLSDSIEAVKSRAEEKMITFTTVTIKSARVNCDPGRMEQVVTNLLNNAVKYSPEKSRIEISLKEEKECLSFSITDEGRGFALNEQKKIFEQFYQIDRSLSRATGSFGLGLSIVKQIVELHGGEIFVESPPAGRKKGTRFIVQIPV
ncbi:MAG: ATP-binding protein [bacterium]